MSRDILDFVWLDRDACIENMAGLVAVSCDVSLWTQENFLLDLPKKWELSFFGTKGGEIVAYAVMSRKWPDRVHLHQFMVRRAERSTGVGQKMLEKVISVGHRDSTEITLKVDQHNASAIRFYRGNGFEIAGEIRDLYWMKRECG